MQYIALNVHCFLPTDQRRVLGSLVNTGCKSWNNIHKKQTLHIGNKYHDDTTKGSLWNYHKV